MENKKRRAILDTRKMPVGLSSSETRARILDAAEQLMREEGYAAATSRRLGETAGVKPQLVHYYFPSMDDLFVELYRRRSERGLQLAAEALKSDRPLRVLWERSRDPKDAALRAEFMALANHRKALRAEIAHYVEQFRRMQYEALVADFERRGVNPPIPPGAVTLLMASVGVMLFQESELGITFAHDEMEAVVEAALRAYESLGVESEAASGTSEAAPL